MARRLRSVNRRARDNAPHGLLVRRVPRRGRDRLVRRRCAARRVARTLRGHIARNARRPRALRVRRPRRPLAALADESARPENAPRLRPFDAWHRRIDEIVLPASTHAALARVAGRERLGALHGDRFAFYAKTYLAHQNGEAGVACSLACTDGLTRLLDALGDRLEHREALAAMRGASAGRVVHAAQFVTEIQGGSDVGANALEAVPDGDAYRLHGAEVVLLEHQRRLVPRERTAARGGGGLARRRGLPRARVPARRRPRAQRLHDRPAQGQARHARARHRGSDVRRRGRRGRSVRSTAASRTSSTTCSRRRASPACSTRRPRCARPSASWARTRRFAPRSAGRSAITRWCARTVDEIATARARALAVAFELVRLWPAADGTPEAAEFRVLLSLAKPVLTRRASDARARRGPAARRERNRGALLAAAAPLPRCRRHGDLGGPAQRASRAGAARHGASARRCRRVRGARRRPGRTTRSRATTATCWASQADENDAMLRMPALAARVVDALGDRVLAG